ncbi:MAG: hypothetical protein J5922_03085 [Clostridia bacterium]|nr:hypothetical protein [Clostridia bacterium]
MKKIFLILLIIFILQIPAMAKATDGIDIADYLPQDIIDEYNISEDYDFISESKSAFFEEFINNRDLIIKFLYQSAALLFLQVAAKFLLDENDSGILKCVDLSANIVFSLGIYGIIERITAETVLFVSKTLELSAGVSALQTAIYSAFMPSAGAAFSKVQTLVISAMAFVSQKLFVPFFACLCAVSIASSVFGEKYLSDIIKTVRNGVCIALTLIMSISLIIITAVCKSATNLSVITQKTIRLASTSLFPIVGSLLGDAANSVVASFKAIINTSGILGALCIVLMIASPLVIMVLLRAALLILRILCSFFGADGLYKTAADFGALSDIAFAFCLFASIMSLFLITSISNFG